MLPTLRMKVEVVHPSKSASNELVKRHGPIGTAENGLPPEACWTPASSVVYHETSLDHCPWVTKKSMQSKPAGKQSWAVPLLPLVRVSLELCAVNTSLNHYRVSIERVHKHSIHECNYKTQRRSQAMCFRVSYDH